MTVLTVFGLGDRSAAQALPGPAVEIPRAVTGGRVPKFDNGRIFVKKHADGVASLFDLAVYARGGAPVAWTATDPQGRLISVVDVTAGDDGGGVVSTAAGAGSDQREFRLWVFGPDGQLARSFVIDPFAAKRVAVDRNGFIWCFGSMGNRDDDPQGNYGVFRRYASNGALLGEFVPRSTFLSTMSPATHIGGNVGFSFLTATRGGIAAFNAATLEWIELDTLGEVLVRKKLSLPGGQAVFTFARLDDGAMFVQQLNGGAYRWHPESGEFTLQTGLNGRVLGGDRDSLVVERWSASARTLEWVGSARVGAAP